MKTNIIKAENLKKNFGTLEVLRGVDFTVERGEIFALLGSNGVEGKYFFSSARVPFAIIFPSCRMAM